MGDPLSDISHILRDTLTHCIDTEQYLGDTRLVGDAFHNDEFWKIDAWIHWFEQDPAALARYDRVVRSIDEAFKSLSKLHHAQTGEAAHVPPALVSLLKLRVATAYFPDSDAIVARATRGSALFAKENLLKYIPEDAWRQRS